METVKKLRKIRDLLKEVETDISVMSVVDKTSDEKEILNPVLEENIWEVNNVSDELKSVGDAFSLVKEMAGEKVIKFLQEHQKMKKFEADLVELSFTTRRYLKITGIPDSKFIIIKKEVNTPAVRAYQDATETLPEGIIEEIKTYPKFKNVKKYDEVKS